MLASISAKRSKQIPSAKLVGNRLKAYTVTCARASLLVESSAAAKEPLVEMHHFFRKQWLLLPDDAGMYLKEDCC
jgi:hypothetical protein